MLPLLAINWDTIRDDGPKVLLIVAVLAAVFIIFRAIFPRVARAAIVQGARLADEEATKRANTIIAVVERTAGAVILLIGSITVLQQVGVDVTAIITGLGITGLALALGAQTLVRDAINGIFLLAEDQYRRGDVIRIADVTGTVEDITLRRTIIRDEDGVVHSVPNGSIGVVSNYTRDFALVNVPVRVSYGEDLARVNGIIERVGREVAEDRELGQLIIDAPKGAAVDSVGDQGVTITVTTRTRPGARWQIAAELRRRLAEAFLKEDIRVPFATVPPEAGEGANRGPV